MGYSPIDGSLVLTPKINAIVRIGRQTGDLDFLIDTGADATTLSPPGALTVLGADYWDVDFANDPLRLEAVGAGQGDHAMIVREAELILTDDEGKLASLRLPIMIAQPDPRGPGQGNWQAPNLLGRDVLQYLDLALSYQTDEVLLTDPTA